MGDRSDHAGTDVAPDQLGRAERRTIPGRAASAAKGFFEQHGWALAFGMLGLGVILRTLGITEWWLKP